MLRQILGVIAGYAIFVATSIMLFQLSGHDPHEQPATTFVALTLIYGAVFSFLSGLVARLIARSKSLTLNYILALIIAGFAFFSLLKSEGSHWTQMLAILIFTPISVFGGLFYQKRYSK